MRYSIGVKFIAFLLAACMLVCALGSALGIVMLGQMGLYASDMATWQQSYLSDRSRDLAYRVLERYTARILGNCGEDQLNYVDRNYTDEELSEWYSVDSLAWDYSIADGMGRELKSNFSEHLNTGTFTYTFNLACNYPLHILGTEHTEGLFTGWDYRDYYCDDEGEHYLYYFQSPEFIVTIRMLPTAVRSYNGFPLDFLNQAFSARYLIIGLLAGSLLIFAALAVYLCCAAGRSPKMPEAVRLVGLNRLPLDLYLAGAGIICLGLASLAAWVLEVAFFSYNNYSIGALALTGIILVAAAVVFLGFSYAVAVQSKAEKGYLWRHCLLGRFFAALGRFLGLCFRGIRRLFRLLPLIWQWLLTAFLMVIVPAFCLMIAINTYGYLRGLFLYATVMACLADLAMVCYGAYAFGVLAKGARSMSQGDLNSKISTQYLFGCFRDFAVALNNLADAAKESARKQLQSDRMKTELITNVSHDIKTPLTSIINYVDLLQKPHSEAEGIQYLEVLSRQSLRLKKLIDDLMDMSKASSGSIPVEIIRLDAVEAVNQALGEFADKLAQCNLTPILQQPGQPLVMMADGKLVWRTLSNLLSNIVKYAMPGTRVYIDLRKENDRVLISLKNISREPLNVSAEELMERFVRGDASRNTEGSGLGLNIAKSLTELQNGQLQLLVDGDLFKATVCFPADTIG